MVSRICRTRPSECSSATTMTSPAADRTRCMTGMKPIAPGDTATRLSSAIDDRPRPVT
jgi:hypothetical protein